MVFKHTSILLQECLNGLNIKPNGIYLDGTLGGAGHAYHVCKQLDEGGLLIGIDQDEDAIKASEEKLQPYKEIVSLHRANYSEFEHILDKLKIDYVDGILLDLGVSSYQLDTAKRGFSYMQDAPLDMRMDQRQANTARDIVNEYSEEALFRTIKTYGEEKWARRIARNIVIKRKESPIETTNDLVNVIKNAVPKKALHNVGHPAKRTFQAIRIELNEELNVLKSTINKMIDRLNPKGRLCIITFHSLEDRIVKHLFRDNQDPCTCPPEFPICVCGKKTKGRVITRKPILPTEEEIEDNRRSKSAKLRIFEKIEGEMDE